MNRKATDWERIFANCISDKCPEYTYLEQKKTNKKNLKKLRKQPKEKWAEI